jgi:uncharacterized protein UPF0149
VKSQPLTDAELERLSGTLGRFDNKHPMNLEQLDGFVAALICGPEIVRPSEYLPVICGNDMVLEDSFGTQSVMQDFLSLIMRHWNVIADTLHSGDVFLPLLLEDENGISHANDWAKASYVEWRSDKQSGLLFWMTKNTAVRSYQFLHWRTSMTQTPPCDLTNSQLVHDYWCRRRCDEYLQIFSKAENSGRISRQRRNSPSHHTQNRAQ